MTERLTHTHTYARHSAACVFAGLARRTVLTASLLHLLLTFHNGNQRAIVAHALEITFVISYFQEVSYIQEGDSIE